MELREDSEDRLWFNFDWETEKWIPAAQALRETIKLFAESRDGDLYRAEQDAIAALQHRLKHGELWARADRWFHSVRHELLTDNKELQKALAAAESSNLVTKVIDDGFWWNLTETERERREIEEETGEPPVFSYQRQDWVSGDFEFSAHTLVSDSAIKGITVQGHAFAVHFNRTGLPASSGFHSPARPETPKPPEKEIKPRLSDAALNAWWDGLSADVKCLSVDSTLVRLCRGHFPNHVISRDRIRALDPGRKRGPKPLRDKAATK